MIDIGCVGGADVYILLIFLFGKMVEW